MSHIFGFAKGVNKALYGVTHTLELTRVADSNALYRKGDVDAAKIKLSYMGLWMPTVTPSPMARTSLFEFINNKKEVYTPFQQIKHISHSFNNFTNVSWEINTFTAQERPRHVFIAFQLDNKKLKQDVNNGIFDVCGVKEIKLHANGRTLPNLPYVIDFTKKIVGRPYEALMKYRGAHDKYNTGMLITKRIL